MSSHKKLGNILLIHFLRNISDINKISVSTYPWELLIRQSRHANLLSSISILLRESDLFDDIPHKAKQHFLNAIKVAKAHERAARWEVQNIYRILHQHKIDFILLKGSAYIWSNNHAAKGRLFGDTDILVRDRDLRNVEKTFVHNGWVTTKLENYDQHYYRNWMHEIPPLHHTTRHTTLDVHHTILPPIIRSEFRIDSFWDLAVEDVYSAGLLTLSLTDMILHSATHLFHEGEFQNALRDLVDLDLLLKQYKDEGNDWNNLLTRARRLGLLIYLYYALSYTKQILESPIPDNVVQEAANNADVSRIKKILMDNLFLKALIPNHPTCTSQGANIACLLLFVRSHWTKMPWYLLLPHLIRKALTK